MPRGSRDLTHIPGAVVHVIIRFVDGRFLIDDEARLHYLAVLSSALRGSDWRLISFAIMSSHIHLALVMGSAALESWIKSLHIRFAQWLNRRSRRNNPKTLGHVFADRPTTLPTPRNRARLLITYHHRNPVEAGVVDDASCSDWTSHQDYLGLTAARGGIDVALGLRLAGFDDSAEGRRELHAFVQRTSVYEIDLRDDEPQLGPQTSAHHPPPPADPRYVVRAAAETLGETLDNVLGRSRRRAVVMVRRVALLVWLQLGGRAYEMATVLGITRSAASRLLTRPHDGDDARARADDVLSRLAVENVN